MPSAIGASFVPQCELGALKGPSRVVLALGARLITCRSWCPRRQPRVCMPLYFGCTRLDGESGTQLIGQMNGLSKISTEGVSGDLHPPCDSVFIRNRILSPLYGVCTRLSNVSFNVLGHDVSRLALFAFPEMAS